MPKHVPRDQCMEMAGDRRINTGELLHPWRDLLIRTVDPAELPRYLMEKGFFDISIEADELQDHLRESDLPRRELWEKLLHYLSLKEGKEPMYSFLYALKSSGYEFQEEWIRERSEQNMFAENYTENYVDIHGPFRKLLELFAGPIYQEFVPQDIMQYFYEKGLLRSDHMEKINAYKTHNQKVLGILHYITLSGTNDWPQRFCEALLKAGESHQPYKDLAKLITPKIDEYTASDVLDDFTEANNAQAAAASTSTCPMETDERQIEVFTAGDPEVMNEAISFTELPPPKSITEKGEMREEEQFETPLKRLNVNQGEEKVNNLSVTKVKAIDVSSGASVFSAEDNTAYPEACTNLDALLLDEADSACKRQKFDETEGGSELKLRAYQMELAQEPLKGLNTIVVAPTGTGKTLVAVYIAEKHLQGAVMGENCVVFLVPYGHLVDQQENKFRQYLRGYQIITVRGGEVAEAKVPLADLLEHNDVVLMTPQCLLNALNEEGPDLLRRITLLFIDECHETKKEHACKKVMSVYLDAKLDPRSNGQPPVPLPQVVGLTASVGVGSAKNKESAKKHLLQLAASLDAQKIQIVRENEADLLHYANEPKEGQEIVEGRSYDPFKEKLVSIMEEIESKIKLIPEARYVEEAPELRNHLLKPIASRNQQQYMNWLSPLEQLAQKVEENKLRRAFITAKERLEVLHRGLQLNDDSESFNALEYIKAAWSEPRFNCPRQLPEEKQMHQLFLGCQHELEDICLMESQMNPKLLKLFEILEQEYLNSGNECRIIIFVRTRELTESLVKWVESKSSIALLRPKAIVGSAELTSPEQQQILQMFQRGECQLLIATSVAEQGLDIAKCNLVIRYEYVTDDVGRVQARGRARAGNARHILVTERKIGQDFINFLKEGMMGEALRSISSMPDSKFKEKVYSLQKEDWEERKRVRYAEAARAKMMRLNAKEFFVIRCFKCNIYACNQEELRLGKDAHRMVLRRDFAECYTFYENKSKKFFDGFEKRGKIYCKRCGRDWGVMFRYKQCDIPVLKPSGIAVTYKNEQEIEERKTANSWKEFPITVRELMPEDLTNFLGINEDQDNTADDDDDDNL